MTDYSRYYETPKSPESLRQNWLDIQLNREIRRVNPFLQNPFGDDSNVYVSIQSGLIHFNVSLESSNEKFSLDLTNDKAEKLLLLIKEFPTGTDTHSFCFALKEFKNTGV